MSQLKRRYVQFFQEPKLGLLYVQLHYLNWHKEYNINAEDVISIECRTANSLALDELSRPEPKTMNDARFSMQFCLAIALLERQAGLEQFIVEKLRDSKIIHHMKKVKLYVSPNIAKGEPCSKATIVKIRMRNGKEYSKRVDIAKGRPENPLSEEELLEKYRSCAKLALPKEKIIKSISLITELEKVDDINRLVEQLYSK